MNLTVCMWKSIFPTPMALPLLQMLFVWKSCQHIEHAITACFQVSYASLF